jgi:hypothetical protein
MLLQPIYIYPTFNLLPLFTTSNSVPTSFLPSPPSLLSFSFSLYEIYYVRVVGE